MFILFIFKTCRENIMRTKSFAIESPTPSGGTVQRLDDTINEWHQKHALYHQNKGLASMLSEVCVHTIVASSGLINITYRCNFNSTAP